MEGPVTSRGQEMAAKVMNGHAFIRSASPDPVAAHHSFHAAQLSRPSTP